MAISTNDAVAVQNNIMKLEDFRKNKNLAFFNHNTVLRIQSNNLG